MFIRKLGILGKTYRHVKRYREILSVLFKYGFADLVTSLRIEEYIELGMRVMSLKRDEVIAGLSRGARIKMALEELGPTFIKMGQILSTRADLLSVELISELPKLQDDVPPFPFSEVRRIVETSLQAPLEELFDGFDEQSISAASIGQVHRARLPDGEDVVVKVQRPGIRNTIEVDLEIMFHIATLMERHLEGWDVHKPALIVEEFAHSIERELDYNIEASHIERFARDFMDDDTIYIPKVFRQTTSSKVLTLEYIDGIKPLNMEELENAGLDRKLLASRGAQLVMKQVFIHGFVHADPHPGNILMRPNNVICFLDFGMMARIDRETRNVFADIVLGLVQRNEVKTTEALLKLTISDEEPNRNDLERDIAEFMDQHLYKPIREVELGKVLQELLIKASRHRLRVSPYLFMVLKAFAMAESLGRALDPDFNIVKEAEPVIRKIHIDRYDPRNIIKEFTDSSIDFLDILRALPRDLKDLIISAKKGKVHMEFEHKGLEPLMNTYDRVSNRLAFAIVLASLVIGSSVIIHANVPPIFFGISLIGLAGFIVAGIMAFWLLISILKHGRM